MSKTITLRLDDGVYRTFSGSGGVGRSSALQFHRNGSFAFPGDQAVRRRVRDGRNSRQPRAEPEFKKRAQRRGRQKRTFCLSSEFSRPKKFGRTLGKIPPPESRFIQKKLAEYVYPQMRVGPFFGTNIKKLRGYAPDTWRYRIGRFRIFYTVDTVDRVTIVIAVDLRRDAY